MKISLYNCRRQSRNMIENFSWQNFSARPNNETSTTPFQPCPDNGDIISLYKNACNVEVGAIEANREKHYVCFFLC